MGGGNYTRDAPENSVINVNDFPSVKGLADYLTYLTENPVSINFGPEQKSFGQVQIILDSIKIEFRCSEDAEVFLQI